VMDRLMRPSSQGNVIPARTGFSTDACRVFR
jgi:hypothetical protein